MTSCSHNDHSLIQHSLNLSDRDHSTKLIDYHGFLTIALEGRGNACAAVREYLLAMEQKARVDTVVYEGTGLSSAHLQELGENMDDPIIQSAMQTLRNSQEIMLLRNQQIGTEKRMGQLENKMEQELSITSEQEHILNQKRDERISRAHALRQS